MTRNSCTASGFGAGLPVPRRPAVLLPPSSWKFTVPICAFCDPLMVVVCSGPPSELDASLLVTPPVMLSSEYRSRLTSGRFRTSFWLTARDSDARGGFDERRIGDDRHDFGDVAGLDLRVDAGVAAHLEDDAGLRKILEAVERDVDLVVAERHQRQRVLAGPVGGHAARELRVDIGRGDECARHGGARRVGHVAQDGAGRTLGPGRSGRQAQNQRDRRPRVQSHKHPLGAEYRRGAMGRAKTGCY